MRIKYKLATNVHKNIKDVSYSGGVEVGGTTYHLLNNKDSPYYESVLRQIYREFRGGIYPLPYMSDEQYLVVNVNTWGVISMVRVFNETIEHATTNYDVIMKQYPKDFLEEIYNLSIFGLFMKRELKNYNGIV